MRSPVSTPELIERVMVRGHHADGLLSSKPKCSDARCQYTAKFVVLDVRGPHEPRVYCGTHKNDRLRLWAWNEERRAREERYAERERQVAYATNLAIMLNDAPGNHAAIVFGSESAHAGQVILTRQQAQRLLDAWSV